MNTNKEVIEKLTKIQKPLRVFVGQDETLMNYHDRIARADPDEEEAHRNMVAFYKGRFGKGEFLLRALKEYLDEIGEES